MQLAPGELIEIETAGGFAYAQVTHVHPAYPEVIRVVKGLFIERPTNLSALAKCPTELVTLFPLGGAIDNGLLSGRSVGTTAIPAAHKAFPTFKMPIRDKEGDVVYWWLWNGDGLSYTTDQDASSSGYPTREVVTVDELMRRISAKELNADT